MKNRSYLLPIALSLALFTGCGLIPKKVELFQKKVKEFPTQSAAYTEVQKQTAQLAKDKAQETFVAAVQEHTSTNVVAPAKAAMQLTDAVSESLGPPKNPAPVDTSAGALADELRTQIAKLDQKIEAFKQKNDDLAGKKIEGTGLVQIPYFIYLGGFLAVAFILWHLGKLALTAASAANPGAAVAVGGMNILGSVAAKGFQQVVAGGEKFKEWAQAEITDPALQKKVLDAFIALQKGKQDEDVKAVVDRLIK